MKAQSGWLQAVLDSTVKSQGLRDEVMLGTSTLSNQGATDVKKHEDVAAVGERLAIEQKSFDEQGVSVTRVDQSRRGRRRQDLGLRDVLSSDLPNPPHESLWIASKAEPSCEY